MADFKAVQEKYEAEAKKRARPEGSAQFEVLEKSGSERLRHLVDDIWADHAALDAQTPPIKSGDTHKFLIVGAGICGLVGAVRLIEQGFTADQIRIVETAGGIGGTWYWNRYPGLHCDVESYIYLPLLEESGFVPSHKYASGVEIRSHLNAVAKQYNLTDKILFRTQVDKLEWDDAARAWKAEMVTKRGPKGQDASRLEIKAEFVYLTAGLINKPRVPKLGGVGLAGFEGDIFHTSLWNYDVTGGSSEEVFSDMSKLADKRVGIIGTGATAIQAVPCLAEYAKELYVFQRTPSAVYPRAQKKTTPEDWAKIAGHPGWQQERMRNFSGKITRYLPPEAPDLVDDAWSRNPAYCALLGDPQHEVVLPDQVPEVAAHYLALDAESSAALRKRVADTVRDPDTAALLTPWYPVWCKRPTFSDTYLEAFNRPSVHLVDTDGRGIDGATPRGLVVGGAEHALDVLVLATGYQSIAAGSTLDPAARAGVTVLGRAGRSLSAKVAHEGLSTLHGNASHGFPNLFWPGPGQSGTSANHQQVLDAHSRLVAHMVGAAHERAGGREARGVVLEVEKPAEDAWGMRVMAGAARFAILSMCTPSYITGETYGGMQLGANTEEMVKMAKSASWGGGIMSFLDVVDKWREEGKLAGIEVTLP
ncbi:hypothetical protein F4809DRAFT_252290 [Biscogniauxia mediterranea]|nr:hypothetical protein F4809DRAFT_252290 [Biscogniauxia mediterranea]